MYKIIFEEYKNAIKAQYEAKKITGIYGSGDLSNLTPAQLRDLCMFISRNKLTKNDESTFRLFFSATEEQKLERAIDNFGTGKLKSVISFLKGEKNSENALRIELAAIIVDYNSRPFKKYIQTGDTKEEDIHISQIEEQKNRVGANLDFATLNKSVAISEDRIWIKKGVVFFIAILLLILTVSSIKFMFFPAKECMQWNVNHYETVDCSYDKLGIRQLNLIVPIDKDILKLEKLDPKSKIVFFKNGKPIVWYSKNDGRIELFNQLGFHPESGKPLKGITNYIIEKYGLKSK